MSEHKHHKMQPKASLQLEQKEKEELLNFFKGLDTSMLKSTAEALSMMVRAFEGKPIDAQDIISKLTNVKNILERSRFPTYPILGKQVYLRLIGKYIPGCKSFEEWADFEAHALIAYKGQSRKEWVDMSKGAMPTPEQQYYINPQIRQQAQQKRRFWQRPKKEETEFVSQ